MMTQAMLWFFSGMALAGFVIAFLFGARDDAEENLDAIRYRYLKTRNKNSPAVGDVVAGFGLSEGKVVLSGTDLDRAIDMRMTGRL